MNPDDIISEGWTQQVPNPDDPNDTSNDYYAYVRRYADGRIVTQYFKRSNSGVTDPADKNFKPDAPIKTTTTTNPDQQRIFQQQQNNPRQTAQPLPSGASPTQTRKSTDGLDHIYQYNPTTGLYDNDIGAIQAAGPPGGKPYIDDGAESGQSGRRWGWNQQTHAYDRDLGPSPSAQAGPASKREPVKGHPGIYTVTAADPTNPSAISTHYENEAGQTVPEPPDAPSYTSQSVTINGKVYTRITKTPKDGSQPTVTNYGPDGQPVAALPTEVKPGTIVKGGGKDKEDVQAVEDPDHPGQIKYVPIAGAQTPSENQPIPAGAPSYVPDYNAPDLGLTDYNERLLAAQQSGLITVEQGRKLLETAIGLGTQTASHGTTLTNQASTTRAQDITQRSQTLGEVQSRRTAADTGFDNGLTTFIGNAAHLGAGHGGVAADAFRAALNLRQAYATQAGGYADVPPVPLSPPIQSVRTTTHYPDGTVQIQHPVDAAPAASPAVNPAFRPAPPTNVQPSAAVPGAQSVAAPAMAAPAAAPSAAPGPGGFSDADMQGAGPGVGNPPSQFQNVPFNPPENPTPGLPVGQTPAYLQPARAAQPLFDPSPVVAELRQRGFSDAVIQQALQEHQAEFGTAA